MSAAIFTYGSLMFAQVWERVVRANYCSAPAVVADYARYEIEGETYPGMIAKPDGKVHGVLYFGVDAEDVAALDAFEGIEYRRVSVTAQLDSGQSVIADTYLYVMPQRLSQHTWNPDAFQMQRFLDFYCRDNLRD
jgi:gamma-glutamylcyclotransferase (GGCT)/AIG2-like uncharacterized protein YtfP